MADTKISDLAAATTVIDTDLFPVVTDPGGTPANKKLTLAGLKNSVATAFAQTLLDDVDAATARATLDLEPGVDVQTYRAELTTLDAAPSSIASAATVDLATATSDSVTITGNTGPITSFGTVAAGRKFHITFASTPQINYNATSMITPYGTANFLATAGDTCWAESLGSGNWRIDYAGRTIKCNSIQVSAGGIATTGAVQADSGSFSTPLPAASGGTNNAFFAVTGPTTSTKTYTIRNASTNIVTAPSALTASAVPYVDANGELVSTTNLVYGTGLLAVDGANGFRNSISGLWRVIVDSNATSNAGRLLISIAAGSTADIMLFGSTQENVFNESGKDQDLRIESDTDPYCLTVDGGNNSAGTGVAPGSHNAAAKFQIDSTTKGFLSPRHTTAQFAAIGSKPEGLEAWDTDLHCPTAYDGTRVVKIPTTLTGSATLDFGSTPIAALATEDLTITVTGAAIGDKVIPGIPHAAMTADVDYFMWVSASDTVTVRCRNHNAVSTADPSSATFTVSVLKAG